MLNTLPVTEIRRPQYLVATAPGITNYSLALLNITGSVSGSTLGPDPYPGPYQLFNGSVPNPFGRPVYNDGYIGGDCAGAKQNVFVPTGEITQTSQSYSTNGNKLCLGISNISNTLFTVDANTIYQYSWSFTYNTASNATSSKASFSNFYPRFGGLARGYAFVTSDSGSNSVGGTIVQWNPLTETIKYLNCSASAAEEKVAGIVYDARRDVIWSIVKNYAYAHNIDTGNLIESRSFNNITATEYNYIRCLTYNSRTDELYVTGQLNEDGSGANMGNIRILNLTTNFSRSLANSDSFDLTYSPKYLDLTGGNEYLR